MHPTSVLFSIPRPLTSGDALIENERFKILRAKTSQLNGKPGFVLDENLTIACKSNSIQILELQRQGKNKQTNKEFLLGNKIHKGTILA